ncbi:MAG: hypothetical protein ACRC62_30530 [Microcoleus sp.]
MLPLNEINQQALDAARSQYARSILKPPVEPSEGFYRGYDRAKGHHRIELPNGRVVQSAAISTGTALIGQKVRISIDEGAIGRFSVMPK